MTKTLMGAAILVATLVATPVAFATELDTTATSDIIVVTTLDSTDSSSSEVVITSEAAARAELKSLKQKEQDPSTGFFTRLIIGFKIKQLETQLNIKKALQ